MVKQLVFRQVLSEVQNGKFPHAYSFRYADGIRSFRGLLTRLRSIYSFRKSIIAILKIMTPRRAFYALCEGSVIVHYGWVSFGFCGYYNVGANEAVIGPIWTSPAKRGEGLATLALRAAMNELLRRNGVKAVFIDTSEDNVPCLKAIEKCGFGPAQHTYERDGS
jgi:GNAT superfamily N-acetyltransferase